MRSGGAYRRRTTELTARDVDNNHKQGTMIMLNRTMKAASVSAALVLFCLSGAASAQDTTRLLVQVSHLKPERVAEWRALQQNEVMPALKKAGVTQRTVLETLFGDRTEYVSLRPLPSFAEFDGDGVLAAALGQRAADALAAKLAACTVSTQRYIINRQNEFNAGATTGSIFVTTRYRINPGAGPSYRQFLRDYAHPLNLRGVQENKILGASVSISGNGAPEPGLWIQTTYLPSVAALDAGGLAGQLLEAAQLELLNQRASQLRTNHSNIVRRVIPELSY